MGRKLVDGPRRIFNQQLRGKNAWSKPFVDFPLSSMFLFISLLFFKSVDNDDPIGIYRCVAAFLKDTFFFISSMQSMSEFRDFIVMEIEEGLGG